MPLGFLRPNRSRSFSKRSGCEVFSGWRWRICVHCVRRASASALFICSKRTTWKEMRQFPTSKCFKIPGRAGGRRLSGEHFREGRALVPALPVLYLVDCGVLGDEGPDFAFYAQIGVKEFRDSL